MTDTKIARDRAEQPVGSDKVLDRRSLAGSHRQLAALLRPDMRVLDVGCGTGAITADVATVVGPRGMAVGTDINAALLSGAQGRSQLASRLWLVQADAFYLPFGRVFDIVTAARVLQWLGRPGDALSAMSQVVRPGGVLLVLDYDHERIEWSPSPPPSMQHFYAAFLAWRANAGFENAIARRLPALFEQAGVTNVTISHQPESTAFGDIDFGDRVNIWAEVASTRGRQMVADGFLSEPERNKAEREYREWVTSEARSMSLHLNAVHGIVHDAR